MMSKRLIGLFAVTRRFIHLQNGIEIRMLTPSIRPHGNLYSNLFNNLAKEARTNVWPAKCFSTTAKDQKSPTPNPNRSTQQPPPIKATAESVMQASANRAMRFVYLRTLPLAKNEILAPQSQELADTIESETQKLCEKHLDKVIDNRAEVHLHMTALAIATHRTLSPYLRNETQVSNIIRAGFGAPLVKDVTHSDEDLLTLNDDQTLRPDYWVVKFALWFAFDKLGAVRKMTGNMVHDFGASFQTTAVDGELAGMPRHTLIVKKCFYNDLCREEGLPHLTKIFCALDRNIYAPLNSSKHLIRFTLDKTLADDGHNDDSKDTDAESDKTADADINKQCEFTFVKIKK